MAEPIRTRNVFVPGGLPEHTYVSRDRLNLESQLAAAKDNLCKLVTVTGNTKSGKSVLTKRVFPPNDCIWIDGGAVSSEEDIWTTVLEFLGESLDSSLTLSRGTTAEAGASLHGEASVVVAKVKATVSPKIGTTRSTTETKNRRGSPKTRALAALKEHRTPLVIDDFHYIDRSIQSTIVRALKGLVFDGHPLVLLAIPHRRYDAVRVEREMTGRVHQIEIPVWNEDELASIAALGFPLLNVTATSELVHRLTSESLGSPHMMQEFCRQICLLSGVDERRSKRTALLGDEATITKMFEDVAKETSKTIFDRLAKGPRQRSDRHQRRFKDGRKGDIYRAVLFAIATLRPGMVTLEYEEIRSALRELLKELPQAHEVSRVLEHMSNIQSTDESSAPVLDWEKEDRRLHITDPFFAFFLRWGVDKRGDHERSDGEAGE